MLVETLTHNTKWSPERGMCTWPSQHTQLCLCKHTLRKHTDRQHPVRLHVNVPKHTRTCARKRPMHTQNRQAHTVSSTQAHTLGRAHTHVCVYAYTHTQHILAHVIPTHTQAQNPTHNCIRKHTTQPHVVGLRHGQEVARVHHVQTHTHTNTRHGRTRKVFMTLPHAQNR